MNIHRIETLIFRHIRAITFLFSLPICLSISLVAFGQSTLDVQEIIDNCISTHGGNAVENGTFSFDFRNYHYTYLRENGYFKYSRTNTKTSIKDVMDNDDIKRYKDRNQIFLEEKDKKKYRNSLNSVIYFAFLPYFLNDSAVIKELLGEVNIMDKDYYKVKVTFKQEDGGDEFQDVYCYWIDKNNFTMDYFAYSYEVDGGGVRFRSAYNPRRVDGVLFQDYVNYRHDKDTPVTKLDILFEKGELKELSRIELENIKASIKG